MPGPQDKDKADRDVMSRSPDEEGMVSRGFNVGQSGRWRRTDGTEDDEVARRYGNEEAAHSTADARHAGVGAAGGAHEDIDRSPNRDKSNYREYSGGRHASREESDADRDGNKARHDSAAYGEAGGERGEGAPAGTDRWHDQAGAGYGEGYGSGRESAEPDGERNPKD